MAEAALDTIELKIEGMDCGHCVSTVERAVRAIPGVDAVKVSLADNNAVVRLDPAKTSRDAVFRAVEDAGFDVPR